VGNGKCIQKSGLKIKGRDGSQYRSAGGWFLKCISKEVGCCEHGNEPFGSVKSGEFLVQPMEFSHLLHMAA
jgi:hypothetical protein